MAQQDVNAISAAIPMRVSDMVRELLQAQWRPLMVEYADWWNGFAKNVFDTLTKAGVPAGEAVKIVFSKDFPRPGQVQQMTLDVVGSTTAIIEDKKGTNLSLSLGYSGFIQATLGGSMSREQTSSQTQQAQSTLHISAGPAGDPSFTAEMLQALANVGFPQLPALPPPTTVPPPALGAGTAKAGG